MARTAKSTAISVRIPNDLYELIKQQADYEDRSIGGQIVHLVRQALAAQ